jgi:predicted nucleic acid-binding protein
MTGTVGVLLRARKRNLIPELKPVIENLLSLNFRLKLELVKTVLEVAGER